MDYRLISTLEENPGWKLLRRVILTKIEEHNEFITTFSAMHSEAARNHFANVQGQREALNELLEIVKAPNMVANQYSQISD